MTISKSLRKPRWIGFDMDECLGSFLSIWPFCDVLPSATLEDDQKDAYLSDIAKVLAFSKRLWIFRPGLDSLLALISQAQRKGLIEGCFILTNNGSLEVAETVRRTLNFRATAATATAATAAATDTTVELFRAAYHRNHPCRKKSASASILSKDIVGILACLRSSKLPTFSNYDDLLFYDDIPDHDLARQIPHYVTVPAYYNYTPVSLVYRELKPVIDRYGFSTQKVQETLTMAHTYEERDLKTDKTIVRYSPSQDKNYIQEFQMGLTHFLKPVTRQRKNRSKKSKSAQRRTRKNGGKN